MSILDQFICGVVRMVDSNDFELWQPTKSETSKSSQVLIISL